MNVTSIDCESTGLDWAHGSRPYYISYCENGEAAFWRWRVDPLTRAVTPPPAELDEVRALIRRADLLIGQNIKFDAHMLCSLMPDLEDWWPWDKTVDTLFAGHLLASNRPKDLTSLTVQYLGLDIQPAEDAMEDACKKARNMVRHDADLKGWAIAAEGREDMPSAGKETWKADAWLPAQAARHKWDLSRAKKRLNMARAAARGRPLTETQLTVIRATDGWEWRPPGTDPAPPDGKPDPGHRWYGVTEEYANADALVTYGLWPYMERALRDRKLEKIFEARRRLLPTVFRMERRGVTLSRGRLEAMEREYLRKYEAVGETCVRIAATYDYTDPKTGQTGPMRLTLPKGSAVNNQLRALCFNLMGLEPVVNPKAVTTNPSLDSKNAIPYYLNTLRKNSKEYKFIRALARRRERGTTLNYLGAYRRFWVRHCLSGCEGEGYGVGDFYRLHPSFKATATDTLRFGCENPNTQNISKRGLESDHPCPKCGGRGDDCKACDGSGKAKENVRRCFGPAPGREWWSLDAKNIELRIPAYESGEKDLIALFERADDPPYYGSEHILNFSVVWPELWADAVAKVGLDKAGPYCKKTYADTNYQWTKNGDFAVGYGAVNKPDGTGTADRAFHRPGAQTLLESRFAKKQALNRKYIAQANRLGYVETLPDRAVDPNRGYPLLCTRTDHGKILETVPLNYHVQGTACWVLTRMMVLVDDRLLEWRRGGFDGHMIMNIHDEIVLDFPMAGDVAADFDVCRRTGALPPTRPGYVPSNLGRVLELKRLMETVGYDLVPAVPCPMGVEYHADNWGEGVTVA